MRSGKMIAVRGGLGRISRRWTFVATERRHGEIGGVAAGPLSSYSDKCAGDRGVPEGQSHQERKPARCLPHG
jgi:hypothetical protein